MLNLHLALCWTSREIKYNDTSALWPWTAAGVSLMPPSRWEQNVLVISSFTLTYECAPLLDEGKFVWSDSSFRWITRGHTEVQLMCIVSDYWSVMFVYFSHIKVQQTQDVSDDQTSLERCSMNHDPHTEMTIDVNWLIIIILLPCGLNVFCSSTVISHLFDFTASVSDPTVMMSQVNAAQPGCSVNNTHWGGKSACRIDCVLTL